jgi:phage-related protein
MSQGTKPLVWMEGEIKTPPFSGEARIEAGMLLRRLQRGENIGLPHSRPMPDIGSHCHELRFRDETKNWRIFYHTAADALVILEVHNKTT